MASAEQSSSPALEAEGGMSPGEFVLKKLFAEFVQLSESKLLHIASQPLVSGERGGPCVCVCVCVCSPSLCLCVGPSSG